MMPSSLSLVMMSSVSLVGAADVIIVIFVDAMN
jgi:hypothetical protein